MSILGRRFAAVVAGDPEPADVEHLVRAFRRWVSMGDGGPSLPACLGVRTAADARRLIRDHWLRQAAATLSRGSSWSRARAIHGQIDAARRFAARRRIDPSAIAPSDLVEMLAAAINVGAPMPASVQGIHTVLDGHHYAEWPEKLASDSLG